jgi:hypothetical protein
MKFLGASNWSITDRRIGGVGGQAPTTLPSTESVSYLKPDIFEIQKYSTSILNSGQEIMAEWMHNIQDF